MELASLGATRPLRVVVRSGGSSNMQPRNIVRHGALPF